MRAKIEEYKAVEDAAMKFVKSVAEGNSSYAKELFIDEAEIGRASCRERVCLYV